MPLILSILAWTGGAICLALAGLAIWCAWKLNRRFEDMEVEITIRPRVKAPTVPYRKDRA